MPKTSVVPPLPGSTDPSVSAEPSGVLAKRVAARGLCVPGVRGAYKVSATDDPWYPADVETGERAAKKARRACLGCPVVAECLELALREETKVSAAHGVRGGLASDERRALIRARRNQGGA